jgi:hypothetical protein
MSTDTVKHANVIEAICGVTAEIDAIGKQGSGNTRGRRAEDIYNVIHPLLPKHGVVIAPHTFIIERVEAPDTKPGWYDERGVAVFRVYGPGGVQDFIDIEAPGIGRDNSDKATGKLSTYAWKTAVGILFSIPTDATIDNEDHTNAEAIETDDGLAERKTKVLDGLTALGDKAEAVKATFKAEGITFSKATAAQVTRMETLIDEARDAVVAEVVEAAKARVERAVAQAKADVREIADDPVLPPAVEAAPEAVEAVAAVAADVSLEDRKVAFLAGLGELDPIYAEEVRETLKKEEVVFSSATPEQVDRMEALLAEMKAAEEQDAEAAAEVPPGEEPFAPPAIPDSVLVYQVLTGGPMENATPDQTAKCVKVIQRMRVGKVIRQADDTLLDTTTGEILGLLEVSDEAA